MDYYDYSEFRNAIREQLCYFPTAAIFIENDSFDYLSAKLFENDLFIWSEMYPSSEMHISFGNVHYEIDFNLLGISPIYLPIAIKIPIDCGITPFFNRESLTYNQFAKNYIKDKIKQVANWFVDRYNSEWKEFETFKECYHLIGDNRRIVKIQNIEFNVAKIQAFADNQCKELQISKVKIQTPEYYNKKWREILNNYTIVGYKDFYDISARGTKHWNIFSKINSGYIPVLVNKMPVGNFRQYLDEKYTGKNVIFIKKESDRHLGKRNHLGYNWDISYKNLCSLSLYPKESWRERIKEWQSIENEYLALIQDETSEFIPETWLIANKAKKKALYQNRGGVYKGLNKQEGDITINYCTKGLSGKYKFKKSVHAINSLHKKPILTVYEVDDDTDGQRERIKNFSRLFKYLKVKFALIGKREAKKLPKIHNFITIPQFMNQTTKPFVKLVTSYLANSTLKNHEQLINNDIIKNVLPNLTTEIAILEKYVKNYYEFISNEEFLDSVLSYAKENNIYDRSIMSVINKVNNSLKDLEFITLLEEPSHWNHIEREKYKKFIMQTLLYKKLYKPETLEQFELVKKEIVPQVAVVEEEEVAF